ncbi:MAG TPA: universal stress protein [Candidatus Sulfomarinibacteraceae bacterium]|nr:universal stress protein [Candidatus Sulfomarinibacteraceae bacterium]
MFKRILLPLDGSLLAECVLPHARAMARAMEAEIIVTHVLEQENEVSREGQLDPLAWHLRKAEAETYLDEVRGRLADTPVQVALLQGSAATTLVEFAQEREVDLIILSSHGSSGLSGWNVGSVAQKIIYRAKTSLMIVPAYREEEMGVEEMEYRHLLVPLDGSQRAENVLPFVNALSRDEDTETTLLHVCVRPEMPRRSPLTPEEAALADQVMESNRVEAQRYLEEVRAQLDRPAEYRVVQEDDLIAALHQQAESLSCDLVVLSAHGYSGDTHRPFGSVVTSFIAYGSQPLLIVQDLPSVEIDRTRAEEIAEQTGKSDSGKGGRTTIHAS